MDWVKQGWYTFLSASLAYFIADDTAPTSTDAIWKSNQTKTVQLNFILGWKTLLWGSPLAPVDSIYTLFSEVHLSQMVPLHSHSSRTLTCMAVKDQETVNYIEWDRDAHTDLYLLNTSLQMSLYFSLKTSLSINLTNREFNMCVCFCVYVCECLHQYKGNISIKATRFFEKMAPYQQNPPPKKKWKSKIWSPHQL